MSVAIGFYKQTFILFLCLQERVMLPTYADFSMKTLILDLYCLQPR